MTDPVSWLQIGQGWNVVTSDSVIVGTVAQVEGDKQSDIFDGLAVATSALEKPRYVPSEQVATITQGTVILKLTRSETERLEEYLEPASSEEIEPDSKGGLGEEIRADVREVEGRVFAPTQRHEHSMNIWRRIALWIRSWRR